MLAAKHKMHPEHIFYFQFDRQYVKSKHNLNKFKFLSINFRHRHPRQLSYAKLFSLSTLTHFERDITCIVQIQLVKKESIALLYVTHKETL